MKGILKPTNEKYFVNEEKGTVVYFIEFEPKFYNIGRNVSISYYNIERLVYRLLENNFIVTGIAKCSQEDTFDLKKGIQIARNRAEIKLAQLEKQVIKSILKELDALMHNIIDLSINRADMIAEKKNFIKNI